MKVTKCCLCSSNNLDQVLVLGKSGLANNLENTKEDSEKSQKYPLELLLCNDCNHVQLSEEVDPEILFSNYGYETGISQVFRDHFRLYAESVLEKTSGTVVDIGSNDCILLDAFKDLGFKTIGVEPAKNLVEKYKDNHILINSFIDQDVVNKIVNQYGKADVVTANNVFAHNRNLIEFASCVKSLLREDGLFIVEVQYLCDLVEKGLFDMIYHEHTSYHHIKPIRLMMEKLGMQLVDAQRVSTHGGSIRLTFQNTTQQNNFENDLVKTDNEFDLKIKDKISNLSQSINHFKESFKTTINDLKDKYDCIYGYAAPAKVVTLLSLFDKEIINSIDFITDDGKLKQDKFLPGYGIEIINTEKAVDRLKNKTSVCVIFAWNVAEDIIKKISLSDLNPNLVIVPLPKLEIF